MVELKHCCIWIVDTGDTMRPSYKIALATVQLRRSWYSYFQNIFPRSGRKQARRVIIVMSSVEIIQRTSRVFCVRFMLVEFSSLNRNFVHIVFFCCFFFCVWCRAKRNCYKNEYCIVKDSTWPQWILCGFKKKIKCTWLDHKKTKYFHTLNEGLSTFSFS